MTARCTGSIAWSFGSIPSRAASLRPSERLTETGRSQVRRLAHPYARAFFLARNSADYGQLTIFGKSVKTDHDSVDMPADPAPVLPAPASSAGFRRDRYGLYV